MKQCNKCKEDKDIKDFYLNRTHKDGHSAQCKQCIKSMNLHTKEKRKKYMAEYRAKNKSKLATSRAEYYKKNKESESQQKKQRRIENRDLMLEFDKKYRQANPEKRRELNNKRRALKIKNGIFKILSKEITRLYNSPCIYCGSLYSIEADHVIPISRGGTHSIGNLVPACQKCNRSKSDKYLAEWRLRASI
jgi:5-methylcytosine-specific restriction endonuclease McrA